MDNELKRQSSENIFSGSAKTFQVIFDQSPYAIVVNRLSDGVFLAVNAAFESQNNISAGDAVGRTMTELGFVTSMEHSNRIREILLREGRVNNVLVEIRTPKGEIRYVLYSAEVIDLEGERCAVAMTVDVTEKHRAEEALSLQKRRMEAASKAARVALWAWDIPTGKIEWTDVVDEMLGYESGEFARSLNFWEASLHPEDKERTSEILHRHLEQGTTYFAEYRIRKKDGNYVWWRDAGNCLRDKSGKVVEMFGACVDFTQQKQNEEQLRRAQKLEAIGTLAGGIAHDFNNILSGMVGYTELALQESSDRLEVCDYLKNVLKACDRAKDLVRQILYFSRRSKYERKPLSLSTVVNEALKLLHSSLPSTIEIHTRLSSGLPQVMADPTQIHQIVMNLCTNAAHAMRGTMGRLEVVLDRFQADESFCQTHLEMQPGLFVCLEVNDTGSGMDDNTQKHAFEPFFTTKGPGEGTGLGLSVVHGIVKDHDGAIFLHSQPGNGTRFQIFFPALAFDEETLPSELPKVIMGNQENILVVDDEPALCNALSRMLNKLAYRTVTETNPRQALALFCANPNRFDLVITDLTMPGMTGIDLANAMIAVNPSLSVLLSSGYSGSYTREDVQQMGIRDILTKPVGLSQLSATVRCALGA